ASALCWRPDPGRDTAASAVKGFAAAVAPFCTTLIRGIDGASPEPTVAPTRRLVICFLYKKIAQKKIVCRANANRKPSEPVEAASAADTATTIAITSEYRALMKIAVASLVSQALKNACPAPGKIPMISATGANPSSTSATTWARITASDRNPS